MLSTLKFRTKNSKSVAYIFTSSLQEHTGRTRSKCNNAGHKIYSVMTVYAFVKWR